MSEKVNNNDDIANEKHGKTSKKANPIKAKKKPKTDIPADDANGDSGAQEKNEPDTDSVPAESKTSPDQIADHQEETIQETTSEVLDFSGMDSTAFIDIAFSEPDMSEESDEAATWINQTENTEKVQGDDRTKIIQDGVDIVKGLSADVNLLINFTGKTIADKAIIIGTLCWHLKKLNVGSDDLWGSWAEKELPFLRKRNRQKYMRIAAREDCHEFTYLRAQP